MTNKEKDYWKTFKTERLKSLPPTYGFSETTIPGTHAIEVRHQDFPMPLAIVWYGFSGWDRLDIFNIFTFEYARRCGLASFALKKLQEHYPDRKMFSGAGTELGQAWMKAVGFRKSAAGWEL